MTSTDLSLAGRIAEFASRSSLEELAELATFVDVTPATALGWVSGATPPKGETLIRLQHYLAFKGIAPEEVSRLPKSAFFLSQLIALRVIDAERAAQEMDYTAPSGLYRIFQGAELARDRVARLEEVVNGYSDAAVAALEKLAIVPFDREAVPQPAAAPATTRAPLPASTNEVIPSNPSFVAQHVAGSLLTASGLVQQLLLMDATEVASVRDLVGFEQISYLIDNLSEVATR